MSGRPIAILVFGAIALAGVLFCGIAYRVWRESNRLKIDGVATQGTVVGYDNQDHFGHRRGRKRRRSGRAVAAVVRFIDVHQQTQTITSGLYTSPPRFQIGERVSLWYSPENPQDMLIEGAEEWLLTTVFGVVGTLCVLVGIPNFVKSMRPVP